MKSLAALYLLGMVVVAQAKFNLGGVQYGACVEMCPTNILIRSLGVNFCPDGYECRSNGCGHTCQKVFDFSVIKKDLRQLFGICAEMCFPGGCPSGQECRSNGCGHTCQPTLKKRALCGPVCANYCPFGHKIGADGCPTCACNNMFGLP